MRSANVLMSTLKNRLAEASSPYLRAHSKNPVAWQQWTTETIEIARELDRPIFASFGYHTCHWCHVMEHESFSDSSIAAILNQHFVPVKVDREERPDLDAVYMLYVQATTGRGGWPLNVFLDPKSLAAFFGGTYWPGPNAFKGRAGPTFQTVLERIANVWETEKQSCQDSAQDILRQIKENIGPGPEAHVAGVAPIDGTILSDYLEYFHKTFDPKYGGFGQAPKFPQPIHLSTLSKYNSLLSIPEKVETKENEPSANEMVKLTLDKMLAGGIHDQIGHGFARYSVTADWHLPHFEKMLYDQANLLSAYTDCFLFDQEHPGFCLDGIKSILQYMTSKETVGLAHEGGGFYSAHDADSYPTFKSKEKKEGAYYVWTASEFEKAVNDRVLGDVAREFWGVRDYGNVNPDYDIQGELKNENILSEVTTTSQLSLTFGKFPDQILEMLEKTKRKLLEYRIKNKPPPELDDKIVTGWNGMALGACAKASIALSIAAQSAREAAPRGEGEHIRLEQRPEDLEDLSEQALEAAVATAEFVKEAGYSSETGELMRICKMGTSSPKSGPGLNEDYAYMVWGLLQLYEATFDERYLRWALELQRKQIDKFWDKDNGGFFTNPINNKESDVIVNMKNSMDNVEPSANGITCENLSRLGSMIVDTELSDYGSKTFTAFQTEISARPHGFSSFIPHIIQKLNNGIASIVISRSNQEGSIESQEGDILTLADALNLLKPGPDLVNTTIVNLATSGSTKWLQEISSLYKTISNNQYNKNNNNTREDKISCIVHICRGTECGIPIRTRQQLEAQILQLRPTISAA